MGVVIYTKDASRYQTGHYLVMHRELTTPPTAPDTTFILHSDRFAEKDVLYWAPVVPYRLVVVCNKAPRLTSASEDLAILDATLKIPKADYGRAMRAALCWADRDRAHRALEPVPLPLANAFVRANVDDIEVGRLLARCRYVLHDDYTRAVIAYGVPQVRDFSYPPKSASSIDILPGSMRKSDAHWDVIVRNDTAVTNEVRRDEPDALPKGVLKKQQEQLEWL